MAASKRELEILLTMRDNMVKQFKASETQSKKVFTQMKSGFAGMQTSMSKTNAGLDSMNARMKNLGKTGTTVKRIITGLLAGFTAFAAVRASVRTITDFEYRMAELQGVTRETDSTMAMMEKTARDLGATTRYSASQAAEGLVFLARAGFEANEAMAALPATLNLATAGNISLGQAADYASNIVSQFNLAAAETVRVVDTMVATANRSNTNVLQLAEALKYAGSISGALGRSVEETSAAIGVLGDRGIQATLAGTNLRGVFAALLGPSDRFRSAIADMGIELEQLDPTTNKIVDIFKLLKERNITAADAVAMFGRRNAAAALIFTESTEKLEALTKANEESRGESERFAATMRDTVKGAALNLKSAMEELILTSGDRGLKGAMRSLLDTMAGAVRILAGVEGAWSQASTASIRLAYGIRAITNAALVFIGLKLARAVYGVSAALIAATASARSFTAALASTPFGAAAVAISLVVGSLISLTGETNAAAQEMENLGDEMDKMKQRAESMNRLEAKWLLALESDDPRKEAEALRGKIRLLEEAMIDFKQQTQEGVSMVKWTKEFADVFKGAEFMIGDFQKLLRDKVEDALFDVGMSQGFNEFKKNMAALKIPKFVDEKTWAKETAHLNEFVSNFHSKFGEIPHNLEKLTSNIIGNLRLESIPITLAMELDQELINRFKEDLADAEESVKALGKDAQKRIDEALARQEQRASVIKYMDALKAEQTLIGQVGLSRELLIATMQVEAKTSKLAAGEREVYLDRIHDEVTTLYKLKEAWALVQEQEKKQSEAISNLAAYLTSLQEEVRVLRLRNEQGEIAYELEKAMALARAAGHAATEEEIEAVRSLLVEREALLEQSKQLKAEEKELRKQYVKDLETPKSFGEGWESQMEQMRDHATSLGKLGETAARDMYTAFDTLFFDAMDSGFKDLESLFKAFISNVIKALMSLAASEMSRLLLSGLSSGLTSLFGGGTVINRSDVVGEGVPMGERELRKGGAFVRGDIVKLAKGAAITKAQQGQIFEQPTIAPLPHGRAAIMGETRPEAAMPLVRDAQGDLAVKTVGAGQTNIVEKNQFSYAPVFPNVTDGPGVRRALDGDKSPMYAEFQRMMTQNRAINRRMRHLSRGGA